MSNNKSAEISLELSEEAIKEGKEGLAKLPMLGPVSWLYARDSVRRYSFWCDLDWLLMPPLVLDQCRLYANNGIPFAYVSWAFVSDEVDSRLRTGEAKIAPHEWKSGPHIWLIDIVTPFGKRDETLIEVRESMFAGKTVNALVTNQDGKGGVGVMSWKAR